MDLEKKPLNPDDELDSSTLQETGNTTEQSEDESFYDTENSTIFSKSPEYKKTNAVVSAKSKKVRGLISLLVSAAVVAAGIFGIVKLVPEKENIEEENPNIVVKQVNTNDISKIVINNSKGVLTLLSDVDSDNTVTWSLEGYDSNLIASSSVNLTADSVASVYAMREMSSDASLDYGDFGLDSPTITAQIYMRNGQGNYSINVGNTTPDKTGYYLSVSGDSKVYLVTVSTFEALDVTPESLAIRAIVNVPIKDAETKASDRKYFDDEGTLSTFDYIEISGARYDKDITVAPVSNNEMVEYTVAIGNEMRYANTEVVTEAFNLLTEGVVAIETYKLLPTKEDIKAYGLDNPDAVIKFKYGSQSVTIRAKYYDEENKYYAAMVDGLDGIYAISDAVLTVLNYSYKDFYNQFIFLEYINDFSNITVKTSEKTYSFDVDYDEEEEEISASMGGKPIDSTLLSAYYSYYTVISPEVADSYIDGKASLTVTFTYEDTDREKRVMEFIKQSDRRYLVILDGQKMGNITSLYYQHLIEYAQNVVDEKGIPDAA